MEEKSVRPASGGKVQIKAKDEVLQGKYANALQIQHTKEEFILDFMAMFPPVANLNNRVIVSPGHYKRMISAMQDNLKKYEEKFGQIESAQNNSDTVNGFPVK